MGLRRGGQRAVEDGSMRHWELTTGAMPMGAPGWPELDLKVVSTWKDCQHVY